MQVETKAAAAQLGVSQRQVQRMAASGRVSSRAVAGRVVVASRSLVAVSRASGRGRRWDDRTVAAAAELLVHGTTDLLDGSRRSRLKARVRSIPVHALAYQLVGTRASLWRATRPREMSGGGAADGFTATGTTLHVEVVPDAARFARQARLVEDDEGDTVLIELDTAAPVAIEAIALYAFGDARTSGAARERVETWQSRLR